MKLLLDESIDRRLARELPGHFVRSVPQMGWVRDVTCMGQGREGGSNVVVRFPTVATVYDRRSPLRVAQAPRLCSSAPSPEIFHPSCSLCPSWFHPSATLAYRACPGEYGFPPIRYSPPWVFSDLNNRRNWDGRVMPISDLPQLLGRGQPFQWSFRMPEDSILGFRLRQRHQTHRGILIFLVHDSNVRDSKLKPQALPPSCRAMVAPRLGPYWTRPSLGFQKNMHLTH